MGLYSPLPRVVIEGQGGSKTKQDVCELVMSVVAKGNDNSKVWTHKLKDKTVMLDNVKERTTPFQREEKRLEKLQNKKRSKVMKAKEQREKNMFKIPEEARKYEMYVPLHAMWKEYIDSLVGNATGAPLTAKLLKADLHGCCLKVTRSKCPSLIGLEGIVLLETEQTFQIITPQNQLRVVPKANNVFTFVVSSQVVTLYGNNFTYRSSDRSARKFKSKPSVEL